MKIFDNVPLPDAHRSRRYDFSKLEVDQMAFFANGTSDEVRADSLRQSARNYGKKTGRRFVVRDITLNEVEGVGIWRVE